MSTKRLKIPLELLTTTLTTFRGMITQITEDCNNIIDNTYLTELHLTPDGANSKIEKDNDLVQFFICNKLLR